MYFRPWIAALLLCIALAPQRARSGEQLCFQWVAEKVEPVDPNSSASRFRREDTSGRDIDYFFLAEVKEGELTLDLRTEDLSTGEKSRTLHARELFDEMIAHFEDKGTKVNRIVGDWSQGTNLIELNRLTRGGMKIEEAVRRTWTGLQSVRHGYGRAKVRTQEGAPGRYTQVVVEFSRP